MQYNEPKTKLGPRMPQPIQLISKNYPHIKDHPILSILYPREKLVMIHKSIARE